MIKVIFLFILKYIFFYILNYYFFDKEGERRKFKRVNVLEYCVWFIDYLDSFGFYKVCV